MARLKKQKADHRADTRGGPWAGIPHAVLKSLAYLHCNLWERAILWELVLAFNGYNNGEIAVSYRQLAQRLRTSNYGRIGRSIAGLMEKGLIDVAADGQWKQRMARQYRLTFISTGPSWRPVPATNDYLTWAPSKKSRDESVSARQRNSAEPLLTAAQFTAEPLSAAPGRKLSKRSFASAEPVSALIDKPCAGELFKGCGWWAADSQIQARATLMAWLRLAAVSKFMAT